MLDAIIESFQTYYGLDWMTLCLGLVGSFLVSEQKRIGFLFSICSCMAGFSIACLSGQYGFVVYNCLLIAIMGRGFLKWGAGETSVRAHSLLDEFVDYDYYEGKSVPVRIEAKR